MASAPADRIPPQSLESERALLGSILLKPDAIHDIADTVHPDSFYAEKHRLIFQAMLELASRGNPIDLLSLSQELNDKGLLDRVGGRAYPAELVNAAPSAGNISYYADLVAQKHLRRSLIEASYEISESAYDESRDTREVLEESEKKVYAIGDGSSSHRFVPISVGLEKAWDRIEAFSKKEGTIRGVPTGFTELDDLLSGLHPSDLVILAARPSVGKTSFALDIARHAAIRNNTSVGIFSLEMSEEQLVDRLIAAQSFVNAWNIRTGKGNSQNDFDRIRDGIEELSRAPLFIDTEANTTLAMRAAARRLKREQNLGLIIVDYLQLVIPTYTRQSDSLVQQVTEISRSLKQLARELNVPVLALSQLSRAVEQRGGTPRLSDLRDSGSIEQDADVVMFIHREQTKDEETGKPRKSNDTEIYIEKHRNGPTGKIKLYFNDKRATFESFDQSHYGELAGEL